MPLFHVKVRFIVGMVIDSEEGSAYYNWRYEIHPVIALTEQWAKDHVLEVVRQREPHVEVVDATKRGSDRASR